MGTRPLHHHCGDVRQAAPPHDGKLAKIGEKWPLSDCFPNAGHDKAIAGARKATPAVATAALRTAQQEAGWLLRERQVAVAKT